MLIEEPHVRVKPGPLNFEVPGKPVGKERPRFSIRRKGKKMFVQTFTPEKTLAYEKKVREACELPEDWRTDTDYTVHIWITFENGVHSDIDNVAKSVLDALNKHVWDDDKQVANLTVQRMYSSREEDDAGVFVSILPHATRTLPVQKPKVKSKLKA
ncbi:MAG: hypothetical protein RLZZ450_105 [Pseudomonadota bacterium]|jgi:Holliday junction resolvase RusA-like endonuclease